jgi:hypothetical protein
MRNPEPWDVADPERTLTDVLREVSPEPDDVYVAMLRTSPGQHLVDVTRVHTGPQPDRFDTSGLLRRHARSRAGDRPWVGRGWQPPGFLFVTVVCRQGRVIPTDQDYFWLAAWRYTNHISNAFDGDVYLVTQHGWTGCMDRRAGFEPRLIVGGSSRRRLAVVPPT